LKYFSLKHPLLLKPFPYPLSERELEKIITPNLYKEFVDNLSREELEMDFDEVIKQYCL